MSFIGKAIRGIGQAIGLIPDTPSVPTMAGGFAAPMASNADTSAAMDTAAQQQAANVMRGRTSTLLTGGAGEDEKKLNTSKVLLGQ